ncbi:hypothetical protein [Clostridium sp.]|uniref:hypothetical protein n=1 Tax=Clostridium sp. TaxID=1506 RepID=UPI002622DC36|nr:hypothetical protein [Clostridium sp.]
MRSWIVNLNLKFVEKYDIPFNSFVIKAEEKEEFLCKMDRVLIKVKELTDFDINDITPFDYKALPEEINEEYVCVD